MSVSFHNGEAVWAYLGFIFISISSEHRGVEFLRYLTSKTLYAFNINSTWVVDGVKKSKVMILKFL